MSNNGNPCWICGAYIEPGNPCDYIGSVGKFECRRCQAELEKKPSTTSVVPVAETPEEVARAVRNANEYRVSADHSDTPQTNRARHDAVRWLASDRERLLAENAAQVKEIAEHHNQFSSNPAKCCVPMADYLDLRSRLEIAERDTARLDFLADWFSDGNDVCLSHDVPDGDRHLRTWRVGIMDTLNVEDYEERGHEKESLREAIDAAIASTSTDREVGK